MSKLPALLRESGEGKEPASKNGVTYLTAGFAYGARTADESLFDAVVFDLGCNVKKAEQTLSRCDIRIAVAGAAPWRAKERESLAEIAEILNAAGENGEDSGAVLLINPADAGLMKDIEGVGGRMLPFPFEPDPLHPGRQTQKILERAIR